MSKTGSCLRPAFMAVLLMGVGLLVWGVERVGGQEDRTEQELPADLACISPAVQGFASLRVRDLWESKQLESSREKLAELINRDLKLQKELGIAIEDIERLSVVMPTLEDYRGNGPVLIVATRKPYDRERIAARAGKGAEKETVGGKSLYAGRDLSVCLIDPRTFAFASEGVMRKFLKMADTKEGPLGSALKAAAEKHLLVQGADWRRVRDKFLQEVPPQLEPFKPVLKAQTWLLVLDLQEKLEASLQIAFDKEEEAEAALPPIRTLVKVGREQLAPVVTQIRQQKDLDLLVPQLEAVQTGLQKLSVEQKGKNVKLRASMEIDPKLGQVVQTMVTRARGAAKRTQAQNNLKQIALSMHNHHDAYGKLPTQAIYSKDGKPLLSWRVAILPFIEEQALYNEFHLDEPWDSEHNKKLLARMPKTYASPADPEGATKYHTHYLGFAGPGAFFEGKKGLRFPADFPDGTSNTIMVVEAGKSVPWSKPEDISFDPDKELPKIGGLEPDGFLAALCDGSVRKVSGKVSKETLRNAILRNDGKVLGADW